MDLMKNPKQETGRITLAFTIETARALRLVATLQSSNPSTVAENLLIKGGLEIAVKEALKAAMPEKAETPQPAPALKSPTSALQDEIKPIVSQGNSEAPKPWKPVQQPPLPGELAAAMRKAEANRQAPLATLPVKETAVVSPKEDDEVPW
jgi:hypothetical protein